MNKSSFSVQNNSFRNSKWFIIFISMILLGTIPDILSIPFPEANNAQLVIVYIPLLLL